MKNKVISLLILFVLIMQASGISVYSENGVSLNVTAENPGEFEISGITSVKGQVVSISVYNPNYSYVDAINADDDNYSEIFAYTNIVTTDLNGRFSVTAEGDYENGSVYTVRVRTADGGEAVKTVEYSNDEEKLEFIGYEDDAVTLEGIKIKSAVHITVLNPGYTESDYRSGNSKAVFYDKKIMPKDGEYFVQIDGIDFNAGNYTLMVDNEVYTLKKPVTLYVSPDGADSGDGTAQKPFASINGAKNYIAKKALKVPVNVIVKDGEYLLSDTINFNYENTGTIECPIVYRAENKGKAVLSGAKKLNVNDFELVTDDKILSRMYPDAAGKIYSLDITKYNLPEKLYDYTAAFEGTERKAGMDATPLSFYLNGNEQSVARYPNKGYITFGSSVINSGGEKDGSSTKPWNDGGIFTNDAARRWNNAENMYIEGFFRYTWHKEWAEVKSVTDNKVSLQAWTMYGLYPEGRWAAVNLLEEIDIPGEWYIDTEAKRLYYYPPYKLTDKDDFEISALCGDIISIMGASNLRFEGLTLSNTAYSNDYNAKGYYNLNQQEMYSDGMTISRMSSYIKVNDCIFEDIVGRGVALLDNLPKNINVDNCIFRNCETAFRMDGGSTAEFKKNYNILKNSDLSDLYNGVHLNGFGNIIKNNVIHNVSQNGIVYTGNENIMKYNEMYNVSNRYADGGAVYAGRSWAKYGNEINKNLFHDIGPFESVGKEIWIVYWDDMLGGGIMNSNILVGTPNRTDIRGVQVAQGPDNLINGNTFVNFASSIIDMSYRSASGTNPNVAQCRNTINGFSAVQIERWKLQNLMKINVNDRSTWSEYKENLNITNNVYSNSLALYRDNPGSSTAQTWKSIRGTANAYTYRENNISAQNSVYVNPSAYDYRIKAEYADEYPSDVLKETNFSMDLIGPQNGVAANSDEAEFKLLYPAENQVGLDENNVTIMWESSDFSDYYIYEVAEDKSFKSIAKKGTTIDTLAEITGLKNDTVYYWRVTAVNNSRQASYGRTSDAGVFTTYDEMPGLSFDSLIFEKDGKAIELEEAVKNDVITVKEKISGSVGDCDICYVLALYDNDKTVYVQTSDITVTPGIDSQKVFDFTMPDVKFDKIAILRLNSLESMTPYCEKYSYSISK